MLVGLSKNFNLDVVQWTFTCLAYLFKYLSRLLVTDLRPTYDVISPLFGKEKQREFVQRFSAEAFSFLLRKAAGEPLDLILEHIVEDTIKENRDAYVKTVALLVADAAKSTGNTLHSKAGVILDSMLRVCSRDSWEEQAVTTQIASRALVELLHHARKETAGVLYERVFAYVDGALKSADVQAKDASYILRLLFVVLGQRKGSRVDSWDDAYARVSGVVDIVAQRFSRDKRLVADVVELCGTVAVTADFRANAKSLQKLADALYAMLGRDMFLSFCSMVVDANKEVFSTFLIPFVQRYIADYATNSEAIALFLIELDKQSLVTKVDGPQSGVLRIRADSEFARICAANVDTRTDLFTLWWSLVMFRVAITPPKAVRAKYTELLAVVVKKSNERISSAIAGELLSVLGDADAEAVLSSITPHLAELSRTEPFLNGLLAFLDSVPKTSRVDGEKAVAVATGVADRLLSPSHEMRYATIKIFQRLFVVQGKEAPQLLSQCQLIEEIPLDISNARNITMHLRNLATAFASHGSDELLDMAVPRFLFGLLMVRFQPTWEGALDALEKAAEKSGELVWQLAADWLADAGESPSLTDTPDKERDQTETPSYDCTNLQLLANAASKALAEHTEAHDSLDRVFKTATTPEPAPFSLVAQALKVLLRLPRLAEKHSRVLVPYLLASVDEDEDADTSGWNFKDHIALLELFAKFVNPRTLYKSAEVYDRYLYLLGNRATNVQRVALECVMTFKDKQLAKYKDNLFNLVDDTQFKDELVNIVRRPSDTDGVVHIDDRDAVFPIAIRILYGRAQIAKTGGVKQGRRFAVLNSLNNVEPKYLRLFVSLAVDRLDIASDDVPTGENVLDGIAEETLSFASDVKFRRELGFVTLLEDFITQLGAKTASCLYLVMRALVYALVHSYDAVVEDTHSNSFQNMRAIRTTGLKCLTALMQTLDNFDWSSYFGIVYKRIVAPRLESFAADNLQQPSAMMRLFVALSSRRLATYLAWDDSAIVKSFLQVLDFDGVKDTVLDAAMTTMANILALEDDEDMENDQPAKKLPANLAESPLKPSQETCQQLVTVSAPIVLNRLPALFIREPVNHTLMDKEATLLVKLCKGDFYMTAETRQQLVGVSLKALEQPTTNVRLTVKVSLLDALSSLLKDDSCSLEDTRQAARSMAKLFRQLSDRRARQNLAACYGVFGEKFTEFARLGRFITDLNSYDKRRLDTPDFDRRLAAFAAINETDYNNLSAEEWLPLLYSMLFFMKDPEELALRTNATYSVKRFIEAAVGKDDTDMAALLRDVLLPAVKLGLREPSLMFRSEFVEILGHLVAQDTKDLAGLDDLRCLLFAGDDEANVFNNVIHIQVHRRRRAVRRISELGASGQMRDASIAHYILPLLEHYVIEKSEGKAGADAEIHNLADDAVKAIGTLCAHISWNQYRAIAKRYISYLRSRPETLRVSIKLIDTVANSLSVACNVGGEDDDSAVEEPQADHMAESIAGSVRLVDTLPKPEKLETFIIDDIVPVMHKVLTTKSDDETLTIRIPLAVPIVKFLRVLSRETIEAKLPGVLTGLCQLLRSRSQELRDMLRRTLGKIASLLGPRYFVFIIREMKGALRRGAQLHILGYSVHALLVGMADSLQPGDLDASAGLISEIVMEDTFGVTGKDKDEEDYVSKMKEVRQHKSFDSAQILAANVSLSSFSSLVTPVRTVLLHEKLSLKIERKVEELLRRYTAGLQHNAEAQSQRVLVMAYEIYEDILKVERDHATTKEEEARPLTAREHMKQLAEEHFTVQLDSRHWDENGPAKVYVANLHTLKRFVLDVVRTVLGRAEELMKAENVAGFVPLIEDGVQSGHENVQTAALRLLTFIIRLPIPDVTDRLTGIGRRTLALIKNSPSTSTELCQSSLKLLTALIRHRSDFVIKESALAYVLDRVRPDLEEPSRQGSTFNFVKAVLSRQIVIKELYGVMDTVAHVMITNQHAVTRDAARSAYFQFLTEYPQSKKRLDKQLQFLVSNLQYAAVAGRLSAMETIHLVVSKVSEDQIREMLLSFFAALVLVLVNDDEAVCREHAAALVKEILARVDKQQRALIEAYCTSWLGNGGNELLLRGGLQATGMYFAQFGPDSSPLVAPARSAIERVLGQAAPESDTEVAWQTVYFAVQLFGRLGAATRPQDDLWPLVESSALLFPHAWVRLAASRLFGQLFSQSGDDVDTATLPTRAAKFMRQLGAPNLAEDLALQTVKNLVFIVGKWRGSDPHVDDSDVEEDVDQDEDSDEDGESDEPPSKPEPPKTGLAYIVHKASIMLRREDPERTHTTSKKSAIQLLAAITQTEPAETVSPLADDIILAMYALSTSELDRDAELRDLCTEALQLLQTKLGTTDYVAAYSRVQQSVAARRADRRAKRAVQAVAQPDVFARRKIKKNLHKRDKRRLANASGLYRAKKRKTN